MRVYFNKGLFDEGLFDEELFDEAPVYDDEAVYFEYRGKDSGIVRITFEMLETLK